jgi:hypothetical protein
MPWSRRYLKKDSLNVIASEAKQSIGPLKERMDCFFARNDVVDGPT